MQVILMEKFLYFCLQFVTLSILLKKNPKYKQTYNIVIIKSSNTVPMQSDKTKE